MRLTDTIDSRATYQFQLLTETDDQLTFTLQRGGQVLRVTLRADGAWPDECYLSAEVVEQRDSESSAEFWGHGDEDADDSKGPTVSAYELLCPAWTITPEGREIDLRIVEGGLF